MAIPAYPAGLPLPLRDGYSFDPVNRINRTEMVTGRARQRVEFTRTPTLANISWIFTATEAQLFQSWADLVAGAGWISMPLVSPLGFDTLECRFTETPGGPELVGRYAWKFTATCEIRWKPLLDSDWAVVLPDFLLNSDVFDYAMNREFPLNEWQVFSGVADTAINLDWPKP